MRTITETFTAGQSKRIQLYASYFRLMEVTAGELVTVKIMKQGAERATAEQIDAGYAYQSPEFFDAVEITAANACTVKIAVSDGTGSYDRVSGEVGILGTVPTREEQTANISHASYAVNLVATNICTAPATRPQRAEMVFYAPVTNTDAVFLGNSVVSTANGSIRLAPGDSYIASKGMAAQWYGISGTAGQTIRTTEIY